MRHMHLLVVEGTDFLEERWLGSPAKLTDTGFKNP
jgi:hypothetical protein